MLKMLSILAGAAAVVAATGASAQYNDRGNDRGYGHDFGNARNLEYRIHDVLRSLDRVRPDQRAQLRYQAVRLDRQLRMSASEGLSPREYRYFDMRISQLERHQRYAMMDRDRGYRGM